MSAETPAERAAREIEKCRWVIQTHADTPHIVARWQERLDALLGVEQDAAYWIDQAAVCMAKARACISDKPTR